MLAGKFSFRWIGTQIPYKCIIAQCIYEKDDSFVFKNLKFDCSRWLRYVTFPQDSFGYSMIGKVHWSHLRTIMRLEDEEERNFYLKETATECWSVRELERNIKSGYYKRILSTQFPDKAGQVPRFVKDPYVLEFMGIKDNSRFVEKNVENAIISHSTFPADIFK